jgi:hypothetical protein
MSPMFFRTSYQRSGTTSGGVDCSRSTKIVVAPGRVKLRTRSRWRVSCSLRSIRSVTCSSVSSSVAPGQAAETIIVRKVKAGSSARPSRRKASEPATSPATMK